MPDKKLYLVTGATGTIGREVVKQLATQGRAVRALVHHPDKAAALQMPGVELTAGDLNEPASLEAALAGVEAAFLLTATSPRRLEQEANLIAAAKRAGIRHIVRSSIVGANVDSPARILRVHGEAEQLLAESGLSFAVLRPNYFMQNLFWYLASIRKHGVFNASLPEDTRHSHIDARDIAAVAAVVLVDPAYSNQAYHLTGPRALTYPQVVACLVQTVGQPVRYESSPEAYAQSLAGFGLDIQDVLDLDTSIANGEGRGDEVTDAVEKITGRPATDVERFVQDYAAVFKGS